MKRFWRDVAVVPGGGFRIALDRQPIRTPGRAPLAVPTRILAEAIAAEWRGVEGEIDPRAMPLTGLANAAIDRVAPDPASFAAGLARYAESDLLCYRADTPAPLVARQAAAWDPLLDWARARYDVHFQVTSGVMHIAQPPATVARLSEAIAARHPFELAPLSIVTTITGSLVMALAAAECTFDPDTLWHAAQVDEDWQREQWGDDALATQAREARRAEYDAAIAFLVASQARDASNEA
ncbi:ATP12 family chaperone protein [Sphingomonas sp.]|uniref:ATP12 family chaperone protein n=1 Tax=Sphingomonas sp. TaxID=28214 RepID=UPI002CB34B26|nr:ATP12 family protein [Sphingomonas sp.]HTG37230.1 ATP12 family protein [Sphingomonas sp.]